MLDYATGKYEVLYCWTGSTGTSTVGMVYDSTRMPITTWRASPKMVLPCRFGGNVERIECYGELAVTKPNAGAVLVDRYYYAKDPGTKMKKYLLVDRVDTVTYIP